MEKYLPVGSAADKKFLNHFPVFQEPVHSQNLTEKAGSAVGEKVVSGFGAEPGSGIKNQIVFNGSIESGIEDVVADILFFLHFG